MERVETIMRKGTSMNIMQLPINTDERFNHCLCLIVPSKDLARTDVKLSPFHVHASDKVSEIMISKMFRSDLEISLIDYDGIFYTIANRIVENFINA